MGKILSQKEFKVLIEKDEDGYYVANVPALPGCHTQAKTMDSLILRVKDAIRLCLSVAKDNSEYARKIEMFSYEPVFIGMNTVKV